MAVIHISEETALRDFGAVLTRFDEGEEIVIDRPSGSIRLAHSRPAKPLTFSEAVARLPEESIGILDEDFEKDARSFRERHPESLDASKWD